MTEASLQTLSPTSKQSRWILRPGVRWITIPLFAFLLTKLIFLAGTGLAYAEEYIFAQDESALGPMLGESDPLLALWSTWDTRHYKQIIDEGYIFTVGGIDIENNVAFFPLYPLLVSSVKPVVGHTVIAGLLVSNLALFLALIMVYQLTEIEFGDAAVSRRALTFLVVFPTAFFFSVAYTESLFLLVSVLSIFFARRKHWFLAVVFAALATATRPPGVLLMVFLGWEWLTAYGWEGRLFYRPRSWWQALTIIRNHFVEFLILLLVPSGLVFYMLYLTVQFGNPLAFLEAQQAWNKGNTGPIQTVAQYFTSLSNYIEAVTAGTIGRIEHYFFLMESLNLLVVPVAVVMGVMTVRRLGAAYGLYAILAVSIGMLNGYPSHLRFVAVVFPVFMMLGYEVKGRWLRWGLWTVFTSAQVFFAWQFFVLRWVA